MPQVSSPDFIPRNSLLSLHFLFVMAKSKSYGGLIVLLLVVAAAAGGGWYYFKGKAVKPPEFQTTKVTRGNITQVVTATGDLQPVITVDIGAQVSGQIKEVLVDFNSRVKAGDVLARIDESTPRQRLNQADADLASAEASNQLVQINAGRTKELHAKTLVSQQELDSINAQLAQSNATLLTRRAAVANAKLDLERTVITAPIDGMVLDRKTDKGRTVNASMNAPVLFTLVNDLSKMQINAAVAEADVGSIAEGQQVNFTVDAFPNRTFTGVVRQVRNAASANQSVVSYATIIDVSNEDLRLKPGMTANVSIVVQQRQNVLRVGNGALRARVPADLLPKPAAAPVVAKAGEAKAPAGATATAAAAMTEDERRTAMRTIMTEAGIQPGQSPSPESIEKARKLAEAKGIDPEMITRMTARGGQGGTGGRGGRRGGAEGSADRGVAVVTNRPVYRLNDPAAVEKKIETVTARLGISDGTFTEVLDGLNEGDTIVTGVIMPGGAPVAAGAAQSGMQNPFQGSSSSRGGYSGGSSGMRGR